MGTMTFNGVSTVDLGVVIQTPPVYEFPSKRVDVIQIQGKNGDIIVDKDSYNNVGREYKIASAFSGPLSFIPKVREIVDWLTSANGYAKLEDSYEPDYFRLATLRNGGQLPNFFDKATAMILRFECKPQRFLNSGDIFSDPIVANESWIKLPINNTKFISLPEITIAGTDVNLKFKVGTELAPTGDVLSEITVSGVTNGAVIDSELKDCYTSTEFLNSRASTIETVSEIDKGFPKLYPGNNWVFISTGATISVKPRWWVL